MTISGEVQGVSYRWSAREQALRLGLTGWVRNLDNGDVEAIAQGPWEQLERFIAWCRRGPPAASVDRVEVQERELAEPLASFEIRR